MVAGCSSRVHRNNQWNLKAYLFLITTVPRRKVSKNDTAIADVIT